MKTKFASAILAVLFLAPAANAGSLSTSVIGLFPKDVNEFAYADLKSARKHKWFAQMKDQMLPSRFRQFEQFLASAGMDPNTQVEELAWCLTAANATTGEQLAGVALGQFQPSVAEEFFKSQKLPVEKVRGYSLFAFGSGTGPMDIFFLFLDSNTSVFGHRALLEKLIEVRFGAEESLLRNDTLFRLIEEANGKAVVWAVLDQGYTRIAVHQLIPEAAQFPDAPRLVAKMKAMIISVQAERGIDARFQTVCASTEDANLFNALLQAGLLYRKMQETESNPDLARALDEVRTTTSGDRLDIRLAVSEELLTSLLRRNTFAVRM